MPRYSPENRRLIPFPGPVNIHEDQNNVSGLLQALRIPSASGYIIFAGPGSGKTSVLKFFAEKFNEGEDVFPVGPVDLAGMGDPIYAEPILLHIAGYFLSGAADKGIDLTTYEDKYPNQIGADILDWMHDAIDKIIAAGYSRVVMLLDNYDDLHPSAAASLGNNLRYLYEERKKHFGFTLLSESDLEELRRGSKVSPFNITQPYQLLDLNEQETKEHARDFAIEHSLDLSIADLVELWDWTDGYPALVNAMLRTFRDAVQKFSGFTMEKARRICLNELLYHEPIKSALREIEELNNLNLDGLNPTEVLEALTRGVDPSVDDRGARQLLAMGLLRWTTEAPLKLTWRNKLIATFWEGDKDQSYQDFIERWSRRTVSYRDARLRAQGAIQIELFMDFGEFLDGDSRKALDSIRGTKDWVSALRDLPDDLDVDGPFEIWDEQKNLKKLAYELNIFREETVRESFMPIYEAHAVDFDKGAAEIIDWLLERFQGSEIKIDDRQKIHIKKVLMQEWIKWHRVRLQLTRAGALHVTLIRDIHHTLPLMQILDELLGLERELIENEAIEFRELSVQWELALMAAEVFMRQLVERDGATLSININGEKWKWTGPTYDDVNDQIYPLRDRYVIHSIRKLCDCRVQDNTNSDKWQLIDSTHLEPLQTEDKTKDAHKSQAYHYGREIASILEGVMISGSGNGSDVIGRFPELKLSDVKHTLFSDDLSSWRNELVVASLDNALVAYGAKEKSKGNSDPDKMDDICLVCGQGEKYTVRHLYFANHTVNYEDYWQSMIMGLQYIIELRWSAQWVARKTTANLAGMAGLMEKEVSDRPREKLVQLNTDLALMTRLLSYLREASVPNFISVADYSARKFERLIEISGLRETIENAEKNIDALNAFLNHHAEQRIQERADRSSTTTNIVATFIAIFALFLTIPSMLADFETSIIGRFLIKVTGGKADDIEPIIGILEIVIIVLAVYVLIKFVQYMRDPEDASWFQLRKRRPPE